MKVLILGGDGFCGWPTALYFSKCNHEVVIVDNLSRRKIDIDLAVESLTPIASIGTRIAAWEEVTGKVIRFENIDIASEYDRLLALLVSEKFDTIVHFAEQRAAPYSMKGSKEKIYTVNNNINATHNVLCGVVESGLDTHIVHLGTMGVYGYGTAGMNIPEGYLNVQLVADDGSILKKEILYPTRPGSVYHLTKTQDQLMFEYYSRNDGVRITDLHQGIVWGTNTDETELDPRLINRFDYDGDYGTVLNRFLMQAASKYPLTVHGTGGQTRAFIHIKDTVRCLEIAIENPPATGERVQIFNQMTETHRVRELAEMISNLTGTEMQLVSNPRNEDAENDLHVENNCFLDLGLEPTKLEDGLLLEVTGIASKYIDRCDQEKILCTSFWTDNQRVEASNSED